MKKLFYLSFLFIFVSCAHPNPHNFAPEEITAWQEQAERVTIIRDNFGIPHVYGESDADAVFGMLYAQAEDDFPRVERNYYWAIGRMAEVQGEEALYSDLRARMYMTVDEAKEQYESAPDWLKELCQAYADGLNYYLYTHPEVKPETITRFEPWFPLFFFEGSIGGDIERVRTSRIKAFYGEGEAVAMADYESPDELAVLEEPRGSNGIAVSGELTESGNAMLLINPHTSFYFRGESQVVSQEGLNAYGATTWGQFFIYQGFNENTGWMHTSTYVDFMDEFVEEVDSVDGKLMYKYGEEWREVEEHEVTLNYRDGEAMKQRRFTFYRTHHGPITHSIDGKWVATKLNWDPVNALIQSFTRTKKKNHDEFREMMQIRRNSSNNTVFADSEGNIAYYHGNFIPKRDPGFDYQRPVDGSDPATDWQGLHTVDEAITILNPGTGWIQNCNSTPFTAAMNYSPKREDYPFYMAPDPENFRAVHAVDVLKDAKDLTLDGLIELAHDSYLPAFEDLVPGLIEAYDAMKPEGDSLREAIEVMRGWDLRTGKESVGMSLAHFYGIEIIRNADYPDNVRGLMDEFKWFGTKSPYEERINLFQNTIAQLQQDFGSWNTPWGEINRFQRLTGDMQSVFDDAKPSIPVGFTTGRWGALAAYGARAAENTKRLYGYRGNSFVAAVEFGDSLRAKSILAGGQSGDPDSPHFFDQAQMYADAKWKDVLFYRKDVEANAKENYSPGKRK